MGAMRLLNMGGSGGAGVCPPRLTCWRLALGVAVTGEVTMLGWDTVCTTVLLEHATVEMVNFQH